MGALLLLPFFLIRFGLLALLNREAIKRAAYFAPLLGKEKTAYWIYQIANVAIVLGLFFYNVKTARLFLFCVGIVVYLLGAILLAVSVINFSSPSENGVNQNGLYRLSRNPMYVAYFLFFLGCALLVQSWLLFGLVLVIQIAAHWIIRSEERWCAERFGEAYFQYREKVRRYF